MKYFKDLILFSALTLCLILPLALSAKDTAQPCQQDHSSLYEILSKEDDKQTFLNHKPKEDLLADEENRKLLSNVYAGVMSNNGDNYAMLGIDVTVDGKETKAYYLVKLNASLLVSNEQKPFYQVTGQFLGFSNNDSFLKTELSFLPFKSIKTKSKEELSVSLMQLKAESNIFHEKNGGIDVSFFAVADILGHTVSQFAEDQKANKNLVLGDVKIGFRIEKNKKVAFSVYAGKSLGYTVSEHEGVVPRMLSTTHGASLEIAHSKKITTKFLYERRTLNTPSGKRHDDTFEISLQFKFRGFEYVYDDIKMLLRRL